MHRVLSWPVQTGFAKPETLLPFLMDKDAFDHFVDAVGLKAAQHRVLWKAIGNYVVRSQPNLFIHMHHVWVGGGKRKCMNL